MTTRRPQERSGSPETPVGATGPTKSEMTRDANTRLAGEENEQPSAYERLRPFIGVFDGGDPQLSEGTGKRLREILEDRQRARRSGDLVALL